MKQQLRDALRFSVNVRVTEWDASTPELEAMARSGLGRARRVSNGHNMIVLAGRNLVVERLVDDETSFLTHFALGTSATATADGQTALVAEVLRSTITQMIKSSSVLTVKYFLSTTQLNGTTIREAGIFNATSGPTMFARYVLSPVIVKDNTIAVTFEWVITLV